MPVNRPKYSLITDKSGTKPIQEQVPNSIKST